MEQLAEWIFNAPWWVLALAAAAAVAFLLWALPRGDRRLIRAALAALAAVALWAVLTWAFVTPIEKARNHTLGLIRAYEAGDWQRFGDLIHEETRFHTLFKGQQITRAAEMSHQEYRPRSVRVLNIVPGRDELGIVVDVRVLTEPDHAHGRAFTTSWRFDYRKRGDEWRLEHIEPRSTETTDVASILGNLPIPPELRE